MQTGEFVPYDDAIVIGEPDGPSFGAVQNALARAVNAGSIVGLQLRVFKDGRSALSADLGFADRETERAVDARTQFRLASMTKPIVSAAAFKLSESGLLDLNAPVTDVLPWFRPRMANGASVDIRLWHLLAHQAGLHYSFLTLEDAGHDAAGASDGLDLNGDDLMTAVEKIGRVPLAFRPGEGWAYSPATDVLGAVMQEAVGRPLPDIVADLVTAPLGMVDTAFRAGDPARLAKAYRDAPNGGPAIPMGPRERLQLPEAGFIDYAPARAIDGAAYPSAGAGMIGTADDYVKFAEMLRGGGNTLLEAASVEAMTTDAAEPFDVGAAGPGFGFGLGCAVVRDPAIAGVPRAPGSFGWGGVYGSFFFVDPLHDLTVVCLTNTALEGLTGAFPGNVTQAVYADLT